MTQTKKVVVHIRNESDKINGSEIFHGLKSFSITYTIVNDHVKWANRQYPYIEVNGKHICIKRLIRMKQEDKL